MISYVRLEVSPVYVLKKKENGTHFKENKLFHYTYVSKFFISVSYMSFLEGR